VNRLVLLNVVVALGCTASPRGSLDGRGGGSGADAIAIDVGTTGGASGTSSGGASARGGASGMSSGSAGTPAAGAPSVGLESDLNRLIAAFCSATRGCCSPSLVQESRLDQCESYAVQNAPFENVTDGISVLDRTKLPGCIAAFQTAASACLSPPVEQACRGIIHGTKRVGEPCRALYIGYECGGDRPGTLCVQDAVGSETGVCQLIPHAAEGEACDFEYTVAHGRPSIYTNVRFGQGFVGCFEADGLTCTLGFESPARCMRPLARGASCQISSQCKYGDLCAGEPRRLTCQAPPRLGEMCLGSGCDEGLECYAGACIGTRFGSCGGDFPSYLLPM